MYSFQMSIEIWDIRKSLLTFTALKAFLFSISMYNVLVQFKALFTDILFPTFWAKEFFRVTVLFQVLIKCIFIGVCFSALDTLENTINVFMNISLVIFSLFTATKQF